MTPHGRSDATWASPANTSVICTSWLPVARIPSVSHVSSTSTPSAFTGTAIAEHAPAALGVLEGEQRREDVARRHLTAEDLAAVEPVPALHLLRGAVGSGEVRPSGGDQDDPVVGDPPQEALRARHLPPVAPRREQGDVVVHRHRQRRGSAVLRHLGLGHGHLRDGGAEAAQLGGHGQREVARPREARRRPPTRRTRPGRGPRPSPRTALPAHARAARMPPDPRAPRSPGAVAAVI